MNFPFPPQQTYSLNGINLACLAWTEGQSPLLLLHGLADHSRVWGSLGNELADQYQILAPDLRGHGDSSKPPTGYLFADYVADLTALLALKQWTKVSVVAHSWAAKLVCLWATQEPERFEKLVLVDPFFIGTIPPFLKVTYPLLYRVLSFLKLSQSFSSFEQIQATAQRLPEFQGWSALQQAVFLGNVEEKGDRTWSSKFSQQARDEVFSECMTVPGLTQPLAIPTLLIKSTQGVNRSEWQLKPYHQYLQSLDIQTIEGNHWAFLTNPADFNPRVRQFLADPSLPMEKSETR